MKTSCGNLVAVVVVVFGVAALTLVALLASVLFTFQTRSSGVNSSQTSRSRRHLRHRTASLQSVAYRDASRDAAGDVSESR